MLLLAGFGAFPGASVNPTERLMRQLEGVDGLAGYACETMILPVEWGRGWARLREAIDETRPQAVLLFGLHSSSDRLRIEMRAANGRVQDRPDAAGRLAPPGPIGEGPDHLPTSLPLTPIERRFQETGIEYELSDDAGRYLCNETLFLLCRSAERLGVRRYGFVHTPRTDVCIAEMRTQGEDVIGARTIAATRLLEAARLLIVCLRADLAAAGERRD